MHPSLALILALALSAAGPHAAAGSRSGLLAVDAIRGAIAARDCALAVDRLKSGLKNDYSEVALLAGSMYENGICVRRDWERALDFYVQAHGAGEKDAAARIAAGYADPLNGPDMAAALWWAWKRPDFGLTWCAVAPDELRDPDRFVAALNAWPAQRLAHCNYVVGVMSTLSTEVKYPELALAHGMGGEVTVRFLVGVPRIELQRGAAHEYELVGWVDGDILRDRKSRKMGDGFEAALSTVANRALRRYPHPGGIAPDTLIQVKYIFGIDGQSPR